MIIEGPFVREIRFVEKEVSLDTQVLNIVNCGDLRVEKLDQILMFLVNSSEFEKAQKFFDKVCGFFINGHSGTVEEGDDACDAIVPAELMTVNVKIEELLGKFDGTISRIIDEVGSPHLKIVVGGKEALTSMTIKNRGPYQGLLDLVQKARNIKPKMPEPKDAFDSLRIVGKKCGLDTSLIEV